MQRQEVRNYSDGQIQDAIMFGLGQVEIIDPPDDLRAEVFRVAATMFSAKQIVMSQGPVLLGGNGQGA